MNIFKRRVELSFLILLFIMPLQIQASGFGLRPANPIPENPRTESIFVHTINPGSFVEDGVRIINNNNEPKSLILYSRDSVRSSGGGFACMQLSETPVNVGEWIKFDLSKISEENAENIKEGGSNNSIDITIPASTEITIPFKIQIPNNASVGEHNGCILIQELKDKSDSVGVSLSMRSGTRVAINVPGEIIRKLEMADFQIEKSGKSINLKPSVKNTGNVSIDATVSAEVRNFLGIKHEVFGGDFPVMRDEIYDFNFSLKKPFWGGVYFAKANFEYDEGTSASIGVSSGQKLETISSKKVWFFSFPTVLGLIAEIFILLVLLFVIAIWRLNKKKKAWIKTWVDYTTGEGETLEHLSKKFRVHWEVLAEVNKIIPPYIIKENTTIKVPPKKLNK